jgi:3-hydroxyisobutyrate dehydrogenase-like beta-hydroxyacid dehydrogenase
MAAAVGRPTVTVVGLGHMGSAIAERLLEAGYPLRVFNRSPGRDEELIERGAERLSSLGAALAGGDTCITSLADDDAVEAAILGSDGILAGTTRGGTLIDMSTISVNASRQVAQAAEDAGVGYLRAPLSGNPTAVRGGTAAVIVSGPAAVAHDHEALLTAIAPTQRYVGDGDNARVLKLVLQILIGGTAELLAEGLALGEGAGIDRKTLLDVIGASVAGSRFIEYKTGPLLADDYEATFTTSMMEKDVDLVLDLSDEVGVDLPLTRELRQLLEAASEAGHGDEDFTSLLLLLQARARAAEPAKRKG